MLTWKSSKFGSFYIIKKKINVCFHQLVLMFFRLKTTSWSHAGSGWPGFSVSGACWSRAIRRNPRQEPPHRNPRSARWRKRFPTTTTLTSMTESSVSTTTVRPWLPVRRKSPSCRRGARVLQKCTKKSTTSTLVYQLLQFNLVGFVSLKASVIWCAALCKFAGMDHSLLSIV